MKDIKDFNPISQIFKHLAISILFMFIGIIFAKLFLPISFIFVLQKTTALFIIFLLIIALFSRKSIIPDKFDMKFVYLFTFIDGLMMYPLFSFYLMDLGVQCFIGILLSASLLFGLLSKISYNKEEGYYMPIGKILFFGLISTLFLSVFNIIIQSDILSFFISLLSLVIFSSYVLYDVSVIKSKAMMGELNTTDDLSIYVLNLYLDFINILIDLLKLASKLKD